MDLGQLYAAAAVTLLGASVALFRRPFLEHHVRHVRLVLALMLWLIAARLAFWSAALHRGDINRFTDDWVIWSLTLLLAVCAIFVCHRATWLRGRYGVAVAVAAVLAGVLLP